MCVWLKGVRHALNLVACRGHYKKIINEKEKKIENELERRDKWFCSCMAT